MKAIEQLKQYGFLITPELEKILRKLPANAFNQIEYNHQEGIKRAKIWCDQYNTTDIIIEQR